MAQTLPDTAVDLPTTPDGILIRTVPDWGPTVRRRRRWRSMAPATPLVSLLAVAAVLPVVGIGVARWSRTGDLGSAAVELAAVTATILAAVGVAPQLRRLVRTGDASGVSLAAAALGVSTEVGWVFYTVQERLWSAVPGAVLMVVTNLALAIVIRRQGTPAGGALLASACWSIVLAVVTVAGGRAVLGALLPLAYAVQVVPAIWAAYRTWSPSGVAAARWVLIGIESVLSGAYGLAHDDHALTALGGVGLAAAAAILVRKVVTRDRAGDPAVGVASERLLGWSPLAGG